MPPEDSSGQAGDGDRGRARPRQGQGASRPDYGQPGRLAGSSPSTASDRARKAAGAGRKAAELSSRAAGGALRVARRASRASGAGESGLYRVIELHAFNAAGDAALAISLAGTLFFQVPSGQARGQIALFLAITMLPFAIMAPLIGPFLDRFRRGRRWAIGSTMAIRALGCWSLAGYVKSQSNWMFLAALVCLIASKAYGITRAAAVPRVVPPELTLVKANSRISLAGLAGAALSGPLAGLFSLIGPEWSLRYASLIFIGATVLAVKLPEQVDSSEGEEQVGFRDVAETSGKSGRYGITPVVITALRCNAGLRMLSGFLTLFMAFLLRNHPLHGWEDHRTALLALVLGSVGVGSTFGTLIGSMLRRAPEAVVVVTLILDVVAAVYAALFFGLIPAMILGLTAGLTQSLGKLSLDALIQREIADSVRTSVFSRSETLVQLSWVVGGFIGVFVPQQPPRIGLFVLAGLMVGWLFVVIRGLVVGRNSPQPRLA